MIMSLQVKSKKCFLGSIILSKIYIELGLCLTVFQKCGHANLPRARAQLCSIVDTPGGPPTNFTGAILALSESSLHTAFHVSHQSCHQ